VIVEDMERRVAEERARIEGEYRRVLETSVAFEKRIRNRWREKCRAKNERIAELEARVASLERRLGERDEEDDVDRTTKERKLVALMINDLGMSGLEETEMVRMDAEVRGLPDEELDRMLASRLGLSEPVDGADLEEALRFVEEPERPSAGGPGGFTGAPDMSHEARPEER
jgi:hypothetical protein